jgi:hypothetical protein
LNRVIAFNIVAMATTTRRGDRRAPPRCDGAALSEGRRDCYRGEFSLLDESGNLVSAGPTT